MPSALQATAPTAPLKIAFLDFNLQKHKLQMGVEVRFLLHFWFVIVFI
jgi:hypothetical protein